MLRINTDDIAERQLRQDAAALMRAALDAVDPGEAIHRVLALGEAEILVEDRRYPLSRRGLLLVVGAGKAGATMAQAVENILGERIHGGLVITKRGQAAEYSGKRITIVEGAHPTPDDAGMLGAQRIAEMLEPLGPQDLVICLISGGGSALLTLPANGIELSHLQELTEQLLRSGATINEINCIRKHLSLIKGGQLARMAYPAKVVTLILSDVVGSPLDVIASGPTVPDPTTFEDAWAILERYHLIRRLHPSIRGRLQAGMTGAVPETPKEGDPVFGNVHNVIIGSNEIAARAAMEEARKRGFNVALLSTYIEGEARQAARVLAAVGKECAHSGNPVPPPACIIAGGETTVTISGKGKGGRNQELAMAAAIALDGWQRVALATLATDGGDGPTDAAGAFVTGKTVQRARDLGFNPLDYLDENDSYSFFRQLEDAVVTGATGTNVNDLTFILVR
jgi:hydroxypyruvate reductase